jgi:hypothetical protein
LAKGGRSDFWGIFSEGKGYLFQKAKMLQKNKEKTFEFGKFGFVSKFGFRASDLDYASSLGSLDDLLRTPRLLKDQKAYEPAAMVFRTGSSGSR